MSDHVGRDDRDRPDDAAARRLRETLASEAAAIQPSSDGLRQIREKIQARQGSRRSWRRPLAVGAAALATAAVAVVAVVVVEPGGSHGGGTPIGATSPTPSLSTSPSPSPSDSASPAASAGPTNPVAIFYVGKAKQPQQLLYREVVDLPYPADKSFIRTAVNAMLTTAPSDPDYVSYWPAGITILGLTTKDGGTTAVLDLSSQANNPAPEALGMGAISAQQLFYTVQAASAKVETLELRVDGKAVTDLWGSKLDEPIKPEPAWQVWAHVWITSPAEGATTSSVVTFGGEATTFESNVTWQILTNGEVVKQGFTTADPPSGPPPTDGPGRSAWQATVTLGTPGTYEIRAFDASGKDGSPTYVDTKTITVK